MPYRIIFLAAVAICSCHPALAQPEQIDLSGPWSFCYTTEHDTTPPPAEAFQQQAPIPGCWDDTFDQSKARRLWPDARFNPDYRSVAIPTTKPLPDASLPYLLGVGWYRRSLDVPHAWRDRQVTLHVGTPVMEAWVYLNGRQIAHHLGPATSFDVPLAPHLDFNRSSAQPAHSANELIIAVSNLRDDRGGSRVRGYKGRSGGIFGPILLDVAGPARIADLLVYPSANLDTLHWNAELQGKLTPDAELHWSVRDPASGSTVAQGQQLAASDLLHWTTTTLDIPPWSDDQPHLVELLVTLHDRQHNVLDRRTQPFGLRRLTVDGTGLRLNGTPVYLRGVCEIAYYPETCTPPLDVQPYRDHIRRLKQLGFNWLRCHTWVPPEPYLQAADELGMLVQVEAPVGYDMFDWQAILRTCRRHPSVVIYCCGNEEQLTDAKIDFLNQCAVQQKQLAPDALFNPQEAMRGIEYHFTGDDQPNLLHEPVTYNPIKLDRLRAFSDVFGQYTLGQLSYTTLQGNHERIDRQLAIYRRPCLTHELGIIGCYLNLDLLSRYQGTRIGPDLFSKVRDALSAKGLLDRAPTYFRNSAAWQRLLRKDVCEMCRHCRLITGYDMLGANDSHWHRTGYPCGITDEFDQLKPGETPDDVVAHNGRSVLLISRQRERALIAADRFQRDLSVSWFDPTPLKQGRLSWQMTTAAGPNGAPPQTLLEGRQPIAPIQPGSLTRLVTIDAPLPNRARPTKATLTVELSGGDARIRNRWDYWLFPRVEPVQPSNVLLVDSLDQHALARLADGARVVMFGTKPFPTQRLTFQMNVTGRPNGILATVIERHPALADFPHDGYCDWQCSQMLADSASVLFSSLDVPFRPIIEVVNSYKNPQPQAALFQWRVGRGRLLICSLNLARPQTDPAAAYLRHCLLHYASGDAFEPTVEVAPSKLAQLLKLPPPTLEEQPKTDQAVDPRMQHPRPKNP